MEQRWVQLDPRHRRHGMQAELARLTGIKRQTMSKWWAGKSEPSVAAYTALAEALQVSRADLLAAFDDTPRDVGPPEILTDGERRLRRKWWLWVARATAGLGLLAAREQLAARGFTSSRGNLVALWEDPASRLEPSPGQLRALAEIYRVPLEAIVAIWNNPPATDEEEMAQLRGRRLEAVHHDDVEVPAERERQRRSA